MRETKLIRHFHQALLVALALPAGCGDRTELTFDQRVPPAACEWVPSGGNPCSWSFTFTGDPSTCVGFATTGTEDECLAICGFSSSGAAPAQREEIAALGREVRADPAGSLVRVAGLPRASQARVLIDAIVAAC
jgi:hypothetical protein